MATRATRETEKATKDITLSFNPKSNVVKAIAKYGRQNKIKDDEELLLALILKGLKATAEPVQAIHSADQLFNGEPQAVELAEQTFEFTLKNLEDKEMWTLTVKAGPETVYQTTKARPIGSDQRLQFGYQF